MYKWICLFLLAATVGCGSPSFLITPVKATADLEEVPLRSGKGWGGGKIVLVSLDGEAPVATLPDAKIGKIECEAAASRKLAGAAVECVGRRDVAVGEELL